ncbi:MAG: metal ABC transporter permease [Hornefia butyriciproducens]|uniref:metal ABC transporter permease n=1 Tax=Hornefia butyriciproducens TaxID=2652293 RepID=UPI0029FB1C0E|nr:metal ABC transporter permease [Hornefia butyriciproducens]MCI7412160.1 metal ABC transporter permease [Clostridiales bacterium]MDD7019985.1 metal ABC transporter permease [Hornefia butyriciproducens]MDY6211949.1 metal ABC transporter permease [Hornefia butyriciproducens]
MTAIMTLTEKLTFYLDYPFVRYAIIVGLLIALVSSLLGVTLVLRHFSYIGDGLSHVAFGAMSVAVVLKLSDRMLLILPVTIFSAVILLKSGQNRRVKGDAAVAMLSVGALAFGYLTVNVAGASANVSGDVCSTLFGSTSILTLTTGEVALCAVLSAVTLMLFLLLYNRLFALTFDENFARVCGISVEFYNMLLAVIIAVIIVLAMNLVGALLVSALIIFPTMAAMRLFESFRAVTAASAAISVSCALIGILVSVLAGTPVGSTIVVADALAFGLSMIAAKMRGGV